MNKKSRQTQINKRAVLFDMDGTVIDTEHLHALALRKVLQSKNIEYTAEELEERFCGVPDTDVFREVFGISADETVTYIDQKNSYLSDIIQSLSKEELEKLLTPGIRELLKELKGSGVKAALVSASEEQIVKLVLERTDLTKEFMFYQGRESTHFSKPSASPYLKAMRECRVDSSEVVIFEDSVTGLKAASETGASVFKVQPSVTPGNQEEIPTIANFSWLKWQKTGPIKKN